MLTLSDSDEFEEDDQEEEGPRTLEDLLMPREPAAMTEFQFQQHQLQQIQQQQQLQQQQLLQHQLQQQQQLLQHQLQHQQQLQQQQSNT